MIARSLRSVVLLISLAVVFILPVHATDSTANPQREDAAWLIAFGMHGQAFSAWQQSQLMFLAWHGVAANLCGDVHLDHEKFGKAIATLEHTEIASMSDEQHTFFVNHLMINYGVAIGIMLAEHADNVDATCAQAQELLKGDPETHLFDHSP